MSGTLTNQNQLNIKEIVLEEINRNNPGFVDDEGAYTIEEWMEMLNCGEKKTRRVIRDLMKKGEMESMKIPITDIAKRRNYTFKYRLL